MYLKRYLVVGCRDPYNAGTHSARLTKTPPALDGHEVVMRLEVELPNVLFEQPTLQASITVPEDSVSAPVISAEVVSNIEEAVQKELGVGLTISVVPQEEES